MVATISITEDFKVEVNECNHTLYQYREGGEEVTVGKHKGSISKPKWEVVAAGYSESYLSQRLNWERKLDSTRMYRSTEYHTRRN